MTSITFYGGVNEIGGNKFLLEDQETRIFLDFGKNFAKEKLYFEHPYISKRRKTSSQPWNFTADKGSLQE